jgi:hypothetical protein
MASKMTTDKIQMEIDKLEIALGQAEESPWGNPDSQKRRVERILTAYTVARFAYNLRSQSGGQ